jgi:hypothetical protein
MGVPFPLLWHHPLAYTFPSASYEAGAGASAGANSIQFDFYTVPLRHCHVEDLKI